MWYSFHFLLTHFLDCFRGSFVSYYNLDVLLNNANVFSFYILFFFFLYFFSLYYRFGSLSRVLCFLYRKFCRCCKIVCFFVFNSSFLSGFLDRAIRFLSRIYIFLYGRSGPVTYFVRSFSTDFDFMPVFFGTHYLFSVKRSFFVRLIQDLESFLFNFRHSSDPDRSEVFDKSSYCNIVDRLHMNSGVVALCSHFSRYNDNPPFFVDTQIYYDSRLVSFFDFSSYFHTLDDFKLFLHSLDLISLHDFARFGEFSSQNLLLFRKQLASFCYGNFLRYTFFCVSHFYMFPSRDVFFLLLISFLGFFHFYIPFVFGLVVLVFFMLKADIYYSLVFFFPFVLGGFGFFFSILILLFLLMSRILSPFFYGEPYLI